MSTPVTVRFDESNIITQHGDMAVTYQGMAHLNQHFFVDRDDLWGVEYETFSHMYPWIDETDFNAALEDAKTYHVSRDNAEELAEHRDMLARKQRYFDSIAFINAYNGDGSILVSVEDENGDPVEDVSVTFTAASVDFTEEVSTDADGFAFCSPATLGEEQAEVEYTITFDDIPEGYDTPDPLTTTVQHGTIARESVSLSLEES